MAAIRLRSPGDLHPRLTASRRRLRASVPLSFVAMMNKTRRRKVTLSAAEAATLPKGECFRLIVSKHTYAFG